MHGRVAAAAERALIAEAFEIRLHLAHVIELLEGDDIRLEELDDCLHASIPGLPVHEHLQVAHRSGCNARILHGGL